MGNTKVFILLAGLVAIFGIVGQAIAGTEGMVFALFIAAFMNLGLYLNSDKMALKSYQAQVLSKDEAPELYALVDRLRQKAALPMPRVAIAPHDQPNAFATGRDSKHAVVCVTKGLLDILSQEELAGVLAHELGHIKNRDMLLQTIGATLSGAIVQLARLGQVSNRDARGRANVFGPLFIIIAPVAAMILQFAISRGREFKADATGAEISGTPLALASALAKLEVGARQIPMRVAPNMAPLAQVNPLSAFGGLTRLFATHPPTSERIARLEAIAQTKEYRQ